MRRGAARTPVIVAGVGLLAVLGPELAPWDPLRSDLAAVLLPPSPDHWLGTDALGRDVLSRLLAGLRVSLVVSLASAALATAGGAAVGVVAGVGGGALDAALSWVVDVVFAVPRLLLAMVAAVLLGSGVAAVTVALALASWPAVARLSRAAVRSALAEACVAAAVALGASGWHVARVHVLPAIRPLLLNRAASLAGTAILAEASLGFLGLGVGEPTPTLGGLIRDGLPLLRAAPVAAVAPMAVVFALALAFHLMADTAGDAGRPGSPSG